MSVHEGIERVLRWRQTVRGRLTLLYGGLFLVSAVVLLGITYGLVRHGTSVSVAAHPGPEGIAIGPFGSGKPFAIEQHSADLRQLLVGSAIALALMLVLSAVLGRFVAARVLRPLRAMASATQEISEQNLHERLRVSGPEDELTKLGDTINGLLGRLQGAFDAQRRFVADASHELRTPLTVTRALLELSLSDPDADAESLRAACRQALEEGRHQEELIDALLLLARSQRGLERREPVDLAAASAEVLAAHEAQAAERGVRLERSLDPARLSGDPTLVRRLIANLVENAISHNVPSGQALVRVASVEGRATLTVVNTGPVIATGEVERLAQPFQRLAGERTGEHEGVGLGLSIVQAIADAHDADLRIQAEPFGGLAVEVRFPPPN